jgi:hypothetical protein
MASDYLDRSKAANNAMGTKAKAVRSEQRRVANIIANKVGNAIGYVVAGPKEAQKYQQVGVLGSKGFVQAAAKVAGAAQKRFGIQSMKQSMSTRALYHQGESVFPKNSVGFDLSRRIRGQEGYVYDLENLPQTAARGTAIDLKQTIGRKAAYTALRGEAAKIGRGMATDVRKVEYAMDKFGPTSAIARDQVLRWHSKRAAATALKQESKRILREKKTPK